MHVNRPDAAKTSKWVLSVWWHYLAENVTLTSTDYSAVVAVNARFPARALSVGTVVYERYAVEKVLGWSANATTYLAADTRTNRQVLAKG